MSLGENGLPYDPAKRFRDNLSRNLLAGKLALRKALARDAKLIECGNRQYVRTSDILGHGFVWFGNLPASQPPHVGRFPFVLDRFGPASAVSAPSFVSNLTDATEGIAVLTKESAKTIRRVKASDGLAAPPSRVDDVLLPEKIAGQRYLGDPSHMFWRSRDAKDPSFPKLVRVGRRRFRWQNDILRWIAAQGAEAALTPIDDSAWEAELRRRERIAREMAAP